MTTFMPAIRPPQRSVPATRVQFNAVDCEARTFPSLSNTLKLTVRGGFVPTFSSHEPFFCSTRARLFSPVCKAAEAADALDAPAAADIGSMGVQSAPVQAVTAAAFVIPLKLPVRERVSWLFQFAGGQVPWSRSRTIAPIINAMQKAATMGTRTSSTRRRFVGTAGMRSCYRTILTVCRMLLLAAAAVHFRAVAGVPGALARSTRI